MIQLGIFLGHHGLDADGVVFVDVEIVDVNLAVDGDSSKHSRAVVGPGHVSHMGVEVKHEQRLAGNVTILVIMNFRV